MRVARLVLIALVLFIIAAAGTPAGAAVLITVNKSSQQMTVEVDGRLRWTWPVSTGQLGHDTPSGKFTAFRMEADHFSKEWDDAPMPHSIFFTQQGHAIHGYLNTSHIGSPTSHGCVRLSPDHATKLYALVEQEGLPNTKVVLTGDVRVALAQRGLQSDRDREENVTTETESYGYAPRYDSRPAAYGYRSMPSNNPPGFPSGNSSGPFSSGPFGLFGLFRPRY